MKAVDSRFIYNLLRKNISLRPLLLRCQSTATIDSEKDINFNLNTVLGKLIVKDRYAEPIKNNATIEALDLYRQLLDRGFKLNIRTLTSLIMEIYHAVISNSVPLIGTISFWI
jgi:hypothetical protein